MTERDHTNAPDSDVATFVIAAILVIIVFAATHIQSIADKYANLF
jgi:hypothetical protein